MTTQQMAAEISRLMSLGQGYSTVAETLNTKGIKTRRGKLWSAQNVRRFIVSNSVNPTPTEVHQDRGGAIHTLIENIVTSHVLTTQQKVGMITTFLN